MTFVCSIRPQICLEIQQDLNSRTAELLNHSVAGGCQGVWQTRTGQPADIADFGGAVPLISGCITIGICRWGFFPWWQAPITWTTHPSTSMMKCNEECMYLDSPIPKQMGGYARYFLTFTKIEMNIRRVQVYYHQKKKYISIKYRQMENH